MKVNQKGFTSIILILFVIVFASVAGYLYLGKNLSQISLPNPKALITPTPTENNETANWKTYTNQEYGFELKYPSDWDLNKPLYSTQQVIFSSPDYQGHGGGPLEEEYGVSQGGRIVFSIGSSNYVSVDAMYKDFLKNSNLKNFSSMQKIQVNERDILRYEVTRSEFLTQTVAVIIHNNKEYSFTLEYSFDDKESIIKTLEKILSTFKLIDQNQTVDASNWKTYLSNKCKCSFKYPLNWYLYRENTNEVVLLKDKPPLNTEGTEIWAYGQQIWFSIKNQSDRNGKAISKEKYIQDYILDSKNTGEEVSSKEWISMGGTDMLKVVRRAIESSAEKIEYFIFKDNQVYILMFYPYDPQQLSEGYSIFNAVISTFKFN